jgi:transportin-3
MARDGAGHTALPCLLELLTVFPQEAGSYRPAVRPDRRRAFAKELILASQSAIHFIAACVQQLPDTTHNKHERVLDAYAAWVRLSQGRLNADDPAVELPQIDAATLALHPLTALALESLGRYDTNESEFDSAVDAVCELVRATVTESASAAVEAPGGIPSASMPLVQLLVPRVMALRPALNAAAGSQGADDEIAKGIARLFAEVGEAYVNLIATVGTFLPAPNSMSVQPCPLLMSAPHCSNMLWL